MNYLVAMVSSFLWMRNPWEGWDWVGLSFGWLTDG